ncbi:hypothetical protein GCM10029992_53830 [Glycomyces albus]
MVVESPLAAAVWKVAVEPGQDVEAGQTLFVLEAMKMETPVLAPQAGRVLKVLAEAGAKSRQAPRWRSWTRPARCRDGARWRRFGASVWYS